MEKSFFTSHDGQEIFYRSQNSGNKKAIVLLHRGHEHSGRVWHIVEEMKLDAYDYFAWDARGNGQTKGKRGDAPDFSYYVKDLDLFIKHISKQYEIPVENIVVIAQSVGAVIAATWIHDYAPNIKAAILASPAFNVNLIIPGAKSMIALWQKIKGPFVVQSYVKGRHLTHDTKRSTSYHRDPLVSLEISSNILLDLYKHSYRTMSDAGAIHIPILLLSSGDDKVVFMKEQKIFYKNLSSNIKQHHVLEGWYHDTLGEKDREKAYEYIYSFLTTVDSSVNTIDLGNADSYGYTYDEYQTLSTQLPITSLKKWNFAITRFTLKYIGSKLSKGIYISEKTGYDSGSTLDYVYQNTARGRGVFPLGVFGKFADAVYLKSIGWRGIRQRKIHLEQAMGNLIGKMLTEGKTPKIMDIAAGHGRYIIDAIMPHKKSLGNVLLRDYSQINIEAGNKNIIDADLQDIANFKFGDAFDARSIINEKQDVNIGVVSGLYELFSDNQCVIKSLQAMHEKIEKGGYLIYTNQPWHPQLEMIARTLTTHKDGNAWIMRRRSQAEMDFLVRKVGFEKREQYIDTWGIFTVCIAQKM